MKKEEKSSLSLYIAIIFFGWMFVSYFLNDGKSPS